MKVTALFLFAGPHPQKNQIPLLPCGNRFRCSVPPWKRNGSFQRVFVSTASRKRPMVTDSAYCSPRGNEKPTIPSATSASRAAFATHFTVSTPKWRWIGPIPRVSSATFASRIAFATHFTVPTPKWRWNSPIPGVPSAVFVPFPSQLNFTIIFFFG